MTNNPCLELKSRSGNCSDEFFSSIRLWIKDGRPTDVNKKCHALGLIYDLELDKLLACLHGHPLSEEVEKSIKLTLEYKAILAKSMELLV